MIARDHPFWPLHAGVWLAYLAVTYVALLPVSPLPPGVLFLNKLVWASSGAVASLPLRAVYRRLVPAAPLPLLALSILGGSAVLAGLWLAVAAAISRIAAPGALPDAGTLGKTLLALWVALLAWSAIYVTSLLWRLAAAERLSRTDAERQLREAELHALRQPLQPHFLFNALASVRALITEDPARAREAVGALADLLRDSLAETGHDTVTVGHEMEAVTRYLKLESMRFEERLQVRLQIDPAAASCVVPAFSIRSLVENAVKHGRGRAGGALQVEVRVGLTPAGTLEIAVENSGSLQPTPISGPTIGLRNLRDRLSRLFPGRYTLDLLEADGQVRAVMKLRPDAAP